MALRRPRFHVGVRVIALVHVSHCGLRKTPKSAPKCAVETAAEKASRDDSSCSQVYLGKCRTIDLRGHAPHECSPEHHPLRAEKGVPDIGSTTWQSTHLKFSFCFPPSDWPQCDNSLTFPDQ